MISDLALNSATSRRSKVCNSPSPVISTESLASSTAGTLFSVSEIFLLSSYCTPNGMIGVSLRKIQLSGIVRTLNLTPDVQKPIRCGGCVMMIELISGWLW